MHCGNLQQCNGSPESARADLRPAPDVGSPTGRVNYDRLLAVMTGSLPVVTRQVLPRPDVRKASWATNHGYNMHKYSLSVKFPVNGPESHPVPANIAEVNPSDLRAHHAAIEIGFILYDKESHGENVQSFSKEYDEIYNTCRRDPFGADPKRLYHG